MYVYTFARVINLFMCSQCCNVPIIIHIITIHGKKYLVELIGIVVERERFRILIKFIRFLVKFTRILIISNRILIDWKLVISTRILIDLELVISTRILDRLSSTKISINLTKYFFRVNLFINVVTMLLQVCVVYEVLAKRPIRDMGRIKIRD